MANGPSLVDTNQPMRAFPEFKAPANNFTPFSRDMLRDAETTISRSPERGKVIITEPPKYQENPTISMSPRDKALADQLMAQIMDKPIPKRQEGTISQIEKKISQEATKKPQGFWARFWEKIKNFFNPWS